MNPIVEKQLNGELPVPGKTGLDWYLFCYFLSRLKNTKFLEIGAGEGGSLISLLAYSNDVTVIDSWAWGWHKDVVLSNIATIPNSVKFIDRDSGTIVPSELDCYDFIHLDASKDYDSVQRDLDLCANISCGIICVDDYMNSMWPAVTWAIDDFIKANPQWKIILIGNHQVFIASKDITIKQIMINFPVALIGNTVYLTYGTLPREVEPFIKSGAMQYSWHKIAWPSPNTTK